MKWNRWDYVLCAATVVPLAVALGCAVNAALVSSEINTTSTASLAMLIAGAGRSLVWLTFAGTFASVGGLCGLTLAAIRALSLHIESSASQHRAADAGQLPLAARASTRRVQRMPTPALVVVVAAALAGASVIAIGVTQNASAQPYPRAVTSSATQSGGPSGNYEFNASGEAGSVYDIQYGDAHKHTIVKNWRAGDWSVLFDAKGSGTIQMTARSARPAGLSCTIVNANTGTTLVTQQAQGRAVTCSYSIP